MAVKALFTKYFFCSPTFSIPLAVKQGQVTILGGGWALKRCCIILSWAKTRRSWCKICVSSLLLLQLRGLVFHMVQLPLLEFQSLCEHAERYPYRPPTG